MNQSQITPLRAKAGVKKKSPQKVKLTPQEQRDLELLRGVWAIVLTEREISVPDMARSINPPIRPETIGNCFYGHRPLTVLWKMRFARYLNRHPQDIWSDWEFKDMTTGNFSPEATSIAQKAERITRNSRIAVLAILDQMHSLELAAVAKVKLQKA